MAKKASKKTTKKLSAKRGINTAAKRGTKTAAKKTATVATKKAVKKSATKKVAAKSGSGKGAAKKETKSAKYISGNEVLSNARKLVLPGTGGDFSLEGFSGKKIVLYFYPKDMTPGCTIQGQEFSKLKNEFEKANTVIFGISRDSMQSHEKFINKESFTIPLLSDEEGQACKAFDVIQEKNMYGKKMMGIERSTFLFSEGGELISEWRKVKAEGHAQEVLEKIKSLLS